jgi:hypothetical protein
VLPLFFLFFHQYFLLPTNTQEHLILLDHEVLAFYYFLRPLLMLHVFLPPSLARTTGPHIWSLVTFPPLLNLAGPVHSRLTPGLQTWRSGDGGFQLQNQYILFTPFTSLYVSRFVIVHKLFPFCTCRVGSPSTSTSSSSFGYHISI